MLICLLSCSASAEEQVILDALELERLQELGAESGIDVLSVVLALVGGDVHAGWDMLPALGRQAWASVLNDFQKVAVALGVPIFAELLMRLMLGRKSIPQNAAHFICRASAVAALAGMFVQMSEVARSLIAELLRCSDVLSPALITAVALSGAETTAAALTPMSSVCANLIQNVLGEWGIALSAAAAAIAIAGNLSGGIQLKRLHGLFRQFLYWMAGILMAIFMGALSIQGRIVAGRDTAATRTARYAIESIVPVVGGNISDSLDSLLSAAATVKNAVGAGGILLLAAICLTPLVRIGGMAMLLKLVSAVAEPLGDDSMTAMTSQFSDAVEMLLVTCTSALVLSVMLAGSCLWAAGNIVR